MTSKQKPVVIQNGKFFIIQRTEKSRPRAKDYQNTMHQITLRIQNCGENYNIVGKYLWGLPSMNKNRALKLAEEIAQNQKIKLDRIAKRGKEPLICWYCENWDNIQHLIKPLYDKIIQLYPDKPRKPRNHSAQCTTNEEDLFDFDSDFGSFGFQ